MGGSAIADATTYALNQSQIILHYLRLVVWPAGFTIDYGPVVPITWSQAAPALAALAPLAAAVIIALIRTPALGLAGLWFFITIAPSSSVVPIPTEVGAERRMYLPLAAIAILLASALYRLTAALAPRVYVVVVAALVVPLAVLSIRRNIDYRVEEQLWRTAVAARPNFSAYNNLGVVLAAGGKYTEAADAYAQALRWQPASAKVHQNLAYVFERNGNADGAIAEYRELLRIQPDAVDVHLKLGNALIAREAFDEAAGHLRQYLAAKPNDASARNGLCLTLLSTGHIPQAVAECQTSITLNPKDALAHFNLGVALTIAGRREEGARALDEAIRLDPTMRADVDGFLQSSGRPH